MTLKSIALWVLQQTATTNPEHAAEIARRYGCNEGGTEKRQAQLSTTFARGFSGEERNPYEAGRGGNFARPLYHAFRAGQNMRRDCEIAAQAKVHALPHA